MRVKGSKQQEKQDRTGTGWALIDHLLTEKPDDIRISLNNNPQKEIKLWNGELRNGRMLNGGLGLFRGGLGGDI